MSSFTNTSRREQDPVELFGTRVDFGNGSGVGETQQKNVGESSRAGEAQRKTSGDGHKKGEETRWFPTASQCKGFKDSNKKSEETRWFPTASQRKKVKKNGHGTSVETRWFPQPSQYKSVKDNHKNREEIRWFPKPDQRKFEKDDHNKNDERRRFSKVPTRQLVRQHKTSKEDEHAGGRKKWCDMTCFRKRQRTNDVHEELDAEGNNQAMSENDAGSEERMSMYLGSMSTDDDSQETIKRKVDNEAEPLNKHGAGLEERMCMNIDSMSTDDELQEMFSRNIDKEFLHMFDRSHDAEVDDSEEDAPVDAGRACDFRMFGKNSSQDGVDEAKQTLRHELRRGMFSKSHKSEKPPYNLGKRGKIFRVYNKKARYHVDMLKVEEVLKQDCCKAECFKKFRQEDVQHVREIFWAMKQPEQLNFLLQEMRAASYFSDEGDLLLLRVTFNGIKVCSRAWGKLYGCSTSRVAKLRTEFKNGVRTYEHRNTRPRGLSSSSAQILSWLNEYFRLNTESMPNSDQFHLPDTLRRRDVYEFFKRECFSLYKQSTFPSRPRFMKIWREECPKVLIPTLKRFSVCGTCLKFKTGRSQATNRIEREMFEKALEKHRLMQAEERQKLSKHRHKASNRPHEYVALIIDGMDQSKTILPHFIRCPKDSKLKEANFVKVHVVGAKVLGISQGAFATLFFDNFKSDSNCMLTVLHRRICQLPRPFPRVLCLTLDNTSKENKNKYVLGYLFFLVKMKVFSKVKLNFLLVGHTHEDIDQMFSCFSRKLAVQNAFDLPELQHIIRESYKVEQEHGVTVEEMSETMDWKLYVQDHLQNVNDISFNQHFRIKCNDAGEVRLWSKQYHNSQWQPNNREGLNIFKSEPTGQIQASQKHAIRSLEARFRLTSTDDEERRENCYRAKLNDQIVSTAALTANISALEKYVQPHNIKWWKDFTRLQETLDLECTVLKEPFQWPDVEADETTGHNDGRQRIDDMEDRLAELFPPERPIYLGARKSRQYRDDRDGKYEDLEVNKFIALRALQGQEERGKPYHIGTVTELLPRKRFKVAWFAQRAKGDGYYPYFKKNAQGKPSNLLSEDIYDWTCGVLCYNFELKTDKTLFASTRKKIYEMLETMQNEEDEDGDILVEHLTDHGEHLNEEISLTALE